LDPPVESVPQQPYSEHKESPLQQQQQQASYPIQTHDLAPIGVVSQQQPQGGGGGAEWCGF